MNLSKRARSQGEIRPGPQLSHACGTRGEQIGADTG